MSNKNGMPATRVHDVVHTPGPWTIEPHGKGFALYSGRDNEHHGLNLVYLTEPDWNWKANAKLIAAAPELLEALQQCLRWIEDHEYTHGRSFAAGNVTRDAIEKATGTRPAEVV